MHVKLHKQFCILETVGHVAVHFMCTETHLLHISLLWGPVLEWILTEIIMNASLLIWFLVLWSETNVLHLGFLCILHQKACVHQILQCVLNRKASYMPIMPMCIKSKSMLYNLGFNVYKIEKHLIQPNFGKIFTLDIRCF